MLNIGIISSGLGKKYLECERNRDEEGMLRVKTKWAAYRDTLSGDDLELCVTAFVEASMPLSEEQERDKN